MRYATFNYAILLLLTFSAITGCDSPGEKINDTTKDVNNESITSEKETMMYLSDMEESKERTLLDVELNERQIRRLREDAKQDNSSGQLKRLQVLETLERQNNNLKTKMIDYKGDSIASWYLFKAQFEQDMRTLSNTLGNLTPLVSSFENQLTCNIV